MSVRQPSRLFSRLRQVPAGALAAWSDGRTADPERAMAEALPHSLQPFLTLLPV